MRCYSNFLYAVLFSLLLSGLSACNHVKKVMNDPDKFKQVFDEGVRRGLCVNDTIFTVKSDTTVKYDTNWVFDTDTVSGIKTIEVVKNVPYKVYVTKTITIHDTVNKVVTDNTRIQLLQSDNDKLRGQLALETKQKQEAQSDARKYRAKFYWLIFLLVGGAAVWLYFKNKMRVISAISRVKSLF